MINATTIVFIFIVGGGGGFKYPRRRLVEHSDTYYKQ